MMLLHVWYKKSSKLCKLYVKQLGQNIRRHIFSHFMNLIWSYILTI